MHRHRLAAVATALVLWMGAAPHLAEGEQQTRRRAGRSAAAAGTEQQRSAPRARPGADRRRAPARTPAVERAPARTAARRASARPPAVERSTARPRAGNPAGPSAAVRRSADRVRGGTASARPRAVGRAGVRERGVDGGSRTVRTAVRRPGRSDRSAGAAPDRAAVRVRRTADAVERVRGRRAEAGGQRRPEPTVDRERRRGGAPSARRAVPRPPRGSGIGPGGREPRGRDREYRRGREQRGRDREYRRGREPRGRDREYRGGRDQRRGYGRRWNRGQRPGYWYGWNYRSGYGYHRLGPRYRHWYAPYTHVHYPGYRHGHVYGTSFFAPGLSFAFGYGLGASAHWYRDYGYYDPHAYGYYGGYAYNPTDLHTGFLRLKMRPRSAQVFVDGYFVGIVNEFDGVFQRLRLEEGPQQVEVVHPGFETLELDVLIVPGEKVTFEGDLIRLP